MQFQFVCEDRAEVTEPIEYACVRFVDSINAFFDVEAFSVSFMVRDSFRIGCQCGWSLSVVLSANSALEADAALVTGFLRRMVLHYETQHNGLKEAGVLP